MSSVKVTVIGYILAKHTVGKNALCLLLQGKNK